MIEKIKTRLKSLGYEIVDESEDLTLTFVMNKVENHIKHFCNITIVPDCLENVFIDMCCGEFLSSKKALGQLTNMEIEQVVKKIQDGDTTVEFATGKDSEATFNDYINRLITYGYASDLLRHRKLVW